MSRFILPLCAACVIAPSLVGAFDETPDGSSSLKNATREELLQKITSLELELAKLQQKLTAQQALSKWLTYTTPSTSQVPPAPTPLPPGIFAWPSYPAPDTDGSHSPAIPNTNRALLSDMPKGTSARQFNGMTVYMVPCQSESPSSATVTQSAPIQTNPKNPHGVGNHRYRKPDVWQQWTDFQWSLTDKPVPMKTSSAAPLRP